MSSSNHPKPESHKSSEMSDKIQNHPISILSHTLTFAGIKLPQEKLETILSYSANIAVSAGITTLAVAGIKLPADYLLQQMTIHDLKFKPSDLKLTALYSGGATFIRFGLPRSCYCIHSKQQVNITEKPHETNAIVHEKAVVEETNFDFISKKLLDVALLAGGETLLTHIPDNKTSLAQQKKVYSNNLRNYVAMSKAGLGIRYSSSVLNLICLTHLNELILKTFFKQDKPSSIENFTSGALSGVAAGIINYPLKQMQTKINVSVEVSDKHLRYPKTLTLFKDALKEIQTKPLKETAKTTAPKLFIRSSQTALLFGMINGVNYVLGPTPASNAYQFVQEASRKPQ